MKSQDSYRIGPGLRLKLRQMVDAFDGLPTGSGGADIPVRLQEMGSMPRRGSGLRIATFTGTWNKGATHTVSFKYAPTGTVSAMNLWSSISASCGEDTIKDCAVSRDGSSTAWFLIQSEC